jgi:5-methylcytosine-specific restriction protein A
MARASARPCSPSCPVLVRGPGKCEPCRRKAEARRGTSTERGYGTAWRRYRAEYLAAHPTCRKCGKPATVVDHIKPHRGDQRLFWDPENHQPLDAGCHGRKTATEDGGFGNPRSREEVHASSARVDEGAQADAPEDPEGFLPAWAQ